MSCREGEGAGRCWAGLAAIALAALPACAPAPRPAAAPSLPAPAASSAALPRPDLRVLDDFEVPGGWTAGPSEGVELRISQDSGFNGRAMRLDFDFHGGAGYAIARRTLPLRLPANWEFAFRLRARAPVNDLEFKLVDPSGENVWWLNRRRFEYPAEWQRLRAQKRQVQFAWGPRGGGEMDSVGALEIVITAGTGGKGTVWIDDLTFREREAPSAYTLTPTLTASASLPGSPPAWALDGDSVTAWRSAPGTEAVLALDFLHDRELGGLELLWDPAHRPGSYVVERSDDGVAWEEAYEVEGAEGGRDPLYLPETDTRYLRLRLPAASGEGWVLREIAVRPPEWSATPNAFFASLAAEAPRGRFPRYLTGEQSYWTVVGVSGDTREATLNADGMAETGIGGPSLEPFLLLGGRLLSWADVQPRPSLERGYLPIPSVAWTAPGASLNVTAFASGPAEASSAYLRYRVENTGADSIAPVLLLALRPLQVNPPWQFLNIQGGVARVREIERGEDGAVWVEGRRTLVPLTTPDAFGAFPFDPGAPLEAFARGGEPAARARSAQGFAAGALRYPLRVPPGEAREVWVGIPLHDASRVAGADAAPGLLADAVTGWEAELGRMRLRLPAAAHGEEIAQTLRSQLAYILINRDGPSIQPGSRSYDRSWIRDGSLTSAALLRLGHPAEVRAFAEWYAPHQRPSGYVPCCVSLRGADPVPEHDSHGQLIYLIAEYHRQTRDSAFLRRMWPHVQGAVAFIDSLRRQRMTAPYRTADSVAYYGMVPQSISHEGYSAKPMHSYWDDSFVLKGLEDAVYVAGELREPAAAAAFAASRDSMRRDLAASLRRSMAAHRIDYLPGSVELGDFDATSTTVALEPLDGLDFLPRAAVEATFERYYRQSIRARLDGAAWEAYTPYEWRTVGSFLRLGWKARAHEAIGLFLRDRRPLAWNQWAEVVFRDPRTPRFIGDMPHTWVGSDFIRSVLDLFAYTRARDQALVVGAGIPEDWVREAPGVELAGLRTPYGPLELTMRASGSTVRTRIGVGLRVPAGGIVLRSPLDRPLLRATVNGRPVAVRDGHEVVVRTVPARVVMEHR